MGEEEKRKGATGGQPQPQQYQNLYGTFQGVVNYPPPPLPQPPVVGFPQPSPPPGAATHPQYYPYGYQSVPVVPDNPNVRVNILWNVAGHGIAEGRPVREHRIPCCGLGVGWILFITGFFFAAIPWYLGALILLFVRVDHREKPGYVACTIAAILAIIATTLGVTKATNGW